MRKIIMLLVLGSLLGFFMHIILYEDNKEKNTYMAAWKIPVPPEEIQKLRNLPIPNEIYVELNAQHTFSDAENVQGNYAEEVEVPKEYMQIRKHKGDFYWTSQDNEPLMVITNTMKLPNDFERTVTIFTAYDGSGVIIIEHDGFYSRWCNSSVDLRAQYIEYRINERKWYSAVGKYFPPRQTRQNIDWCSTPSNIWVRPDGYVFKYLKSYLGSIL